MSGYREHSFDPFGSPEVRGGPPMRPFNWVQWTGVVLACAGLAIDIAYVGSSFGWWRKWLDVPTMATPLVVFGMLMITSRRRPVTDPAPELAAARRRWLAIVVAISAVILGVATVFALKGY